MSDAPQSLAKPDPISYAIRDVADALVAIRRGEEVIVASQKALQRAMAGDPIRRVLVHRSSWDAVVLELRLHSDALVAVALLDTVPCFELDKPESEDTYFVRDGAAQAAQVLIDSKVV